MNGLLASESRTDDAAITGVPKLRPPSVERHTRTRESPGSAVEKLADA